MHIPTTENLFEHECLFKDMKLSGFNPETLSYYCGVCGGKISLKKTKEADEYIKQNASLKFSRQLYLLCTEPKKAKTTEKKAANTAKTAIEAAKGPNQKAKETLTSAKKAPKKAAAKTKKK